MMTSTESKAPTAIVVGASSGIGEELARQLAAKGYRLGLMARREDRLRQIALELETEARVAVAEITKPDASMSAMRQLIKHFQTAFIVASDLASVYRQ